MADLAAIYGDVVVEPQHEELGSLLFPRELRPWVAATQQRHPEREWYLEHISCHTKRLLCGVRVDKQELAVVVHIHQQVIVPPRYHSVSQMA